MSAASTRPRRQVAGGSAVASAGLVLLLAAGSAQAQMFHLYLQCEGTLAAGLQAAAGATGTAGPATPPPAAAQDTVVAARGVDLRNDEPSDKNVGDINENVQVRARAVRSAAKRGNAHIDLALRDNNMTAFVQRSNVLPTGERMRYVATPAYYTATYSPAPASQAYRDWRGSWLFTWHPPFEKMAATRLTIDRRSGRLEGDIVGPGGEVMGLIDMQCEPRREGEGPAPRF